MESFIDTKWLVAPWQIQVALGSGYAAYMAAYTGIRAHHQGVDVTFRAIAFGLIATVVLMLVPIDRPVTAIVAAFGATLGAGLCWRRFGMHCWERSLRGGDISWGDDTPSAWVRMISDQRHYVSQISVLTKDDRWLRCDDTERFRDAPLGPCVLGTNGDIILYLTHVKDAEGTREVQVLDEYHGARSTYIPVDEIRQVNIRRKPISKS